MSLRWRLTLGFFTFAVLLAALGLVSVRENRAISAKVRAMVESSIDEVDTATLLELALREAAGASRELRLAGDGDERTDAAQRLRQAATEARYQLGAGRLATQKAIAFADAKGDWRLRAREREELASRVDPIDEELAIFEQQVASSTAFASAADGADPADAADAADELVPHLEGKLLPLVRAHRLESLHVSAADAQCLAATAGAATRLVAGVALCAIAAALGLGSVLSRAISRPLAALGQAAAAIGRGELQSRVGWRSADEFGELATAFDQMAEALGRTTVSKRYLDEVIDTMTGALIILDPDTRVQSVNRAALELLGYAEAELLGQPLDLVCPDRDPTNTGSLVRLSDDGSVRNLDRNFVRKDGTIVPVSFSGSTLRRADGALQEFVCVAYDISERKEMERRLRASLGEKELLLREVHHRVKNNLQVISSLLDLQADHAPEGEARGLLQESRNRIRSMALIHEQLYRTDEVGEIKLGEYLQKLVAHLGHSYGIEPGRIRLVLAVEEHPLDLDRAISCGLLLNELVSNCLKHAFPDGARGTVRVALGRCAEDRLRLLVADDGRGMQGDRRPGAVGSLGLVLVRTLVEQLHGRLEVTNVGGTEVTVEFPLERGPRTRANQPQKGA